ncbi:MAG TPA: hypothetical protein VGJ70_13620 [Solirubrobacteraceae bacterium]|jgi:hypothetical protein
MKQTTQRSTQRSARAAAGYVATLMRKAARRRYAAGPGPARTSVADPGRAVGNALANLTDGSEVARSVS